MFRFFFLKNIKSIATFLFPKHFQPSKRVQHKSSLSKSKAPSSGKSKEVFFPPLKLEVIRDKVALVTGGSEGIGLKCVKELLKYGAKGVMIADCNETKGFNKVVDFSKEYGSHRVAFIQINPSSYIFLKNAFISTINYYKRLDIVVNCVKLHEKNWEDQVDENIKGIVLSSQLGLEYMGRQNGGNGGVLVNVVSDYPQCSESSPLFVAVQDFIIRFDHSVASTHFDVSDVKVLTVCKATSDTVGCELIRVITKGGNGCVWIP